MLVLGTVLSSRRAYLPELAPYLGASGCHRACRCSAPGLVAGLHRAVSLHLSG